MILLPRFTSLCSSSKNTENYELLFFGFLSPTFFHTVKSSFIGNCARLDNIHKNKITIETTNNNNI